MKTQLIERAMQVFEEVFELEGVARQQAIGEACDGDESLREEVELLLANVKGIEIAESAQPSDDSDSVFRTPSIDRYELLDEIGHGGMGAVYRATDHQLDREVAVKVIRNSSFGAEALRRFSAEARIAARLQHPGIAPVYDSGLLPDGRPFLAMKLVDGRTLASMLLESSRPTVDRSRLLAAFEDLCQVIAYAHSHNIIHRDLKPDNVMVGAFGEVQVMDWGLAKCLDDRGHSVDPPVESDSFPNPSWPSGSETRLGTVMGTPAYMPPEQMVGIRGKQTDVFSLGAILCEILTGRPPYVAESADELLSKSAKADLDEANRRLDDCGIDAELVDLCKLCLHPEPTERPPDGAEVARRVSSHLQTVQSRLRDAEMARARSETRAVEEAKRRRVKTMLLVTAVVLAFVLLGGWAWITRRETERLREQAIRRATSLQRINRSMEAAIGLQQAAEEADVDDVAAWESVEAAIDQLQSLLDRHVPANVAKDVNLLADRIATQAADRKLIADIEAARERSLQQVTLPGEPEATIRQRRYEHLATVLQETPFAGDSLDEVAARRFLATKELPVQESLIGAIDEFLVACDSLPRRRWLVETINAVDENQWRRDWRDAVINDDLPRLRNLLINEQTFTQSPRSVVNLCWSVQEIAPGVNTTRALQRVYREHVEDFWLNCALGDQALRLGSNHLAAQYYQYALGVRPMSSLHREIGGVFLKTGWLDDARYHLLRAIDLNDRSEMSWELLAVTYLRLGNLTESGAAFQRAGVLCSNQFSRVADYVDYLDRSGRRSEAIEYLRRCRADAAGIADTLHRKLINLFYLEQRYLESIDEFERYTEQQFSDPLLHVTLSHASIMAADGIGAGSEELTAAQQNQLRRKACEWLTCALAFWVSRRTNEPVLRAIVGKRDAGSFNSVFQSEHLAKLPTEQRTEWRNLWSTVADGERQQLVFDASSYKMEDWTAFDPVNISSSAGTNFQQLEDGSFLAEGPTEERDVYTLTIDVDWDGIEAIRLDVIADERLPKRGPGRHATGNFHLAEIELWIEDKSSEESRRQILFDRAIATYSWQDRPIANAIDGDPNTLWHVWGKLGHSQTANFFLADPLKRHNGERLTIRLIHGGDGVNATLGRFRVSLRRRTQSEPPESSISMQKQTITELGRANERIEFASGTQSP